jgi:hypothetical protein
MKIIEQSHKIISLPDNPLQMIEAAGREFGRWGRRYDSTTLPRVRPADDIFGCEHGILLPGVPGKGGKR